jgi:hypothetical protein
VAPGQGPSSSLAEEPNKGTLQGDTHRIVTRGLELIHVPQTRDQVINALKTSPNPVQGVADQTVALIQRIDSLSRQEGKEINMEAKLFGGKELVDEIAELSEAAGAGALDDDDKDLATTVAVQDYLKGEIKAGRVDPEELKAVMTEQMGSLDKEQLEAANQQMIKIDATNDRLQGNENATQEKPEEAV